MVMALRIKIIGNACIIRYNSGEGDLKTIIDTNYAKLASADRAAVVSYVSEERPDIPYETEAKP